MLRVVCWKWRAKPGYRSQFSAEHVNIFRNMVERNYQKPHEVVCITDDPVGIDPRVRVVPLWSDFSDLVSLHGELQPSCFRRLKIFAPEMAEVIGPRFVSLDLDVVIVKDVSPLWDRPEDFVIWNSPLKKTPYNGTMFMMNAGARKQVYETFHPLKSPQIARRAGFLGSDQAWISYVLGPNEAVWTYQDGMLAWRSDLKRRVYTLPPHARIVSFHGHVDPWDNQARTLANWVVEHYR